MLAERIHHEAAEAGVSLADCTTQVETDGHIYLHIFLIFITYFYLFLIFYPFLYGTIFCLRNDLKSTWNFGENRRSAQCNI